MKTKLAKADKTKEENRIRAGHVYSRGMNCIMLFWVLLMKISRKNNLHVPSTVSMDPDYKFIILT